MKRIFFISAFCFSAAVAFAQSAPAPAGSFTVVPMDKGNIPGSTEPLALKETEYNFGKIPQGKPVTHVFEVSNTGKTPFKLDNVQASCGCTTPVWEKDKMIAPGTTDNITVGYNAAAEGPFTKSITVTYNGTQTRVILIKGEVWKTPASSAPANTGLNELKN